MATGVSQFWSGGGLAVSGSSKGGRVMVVRGFPGSSSGTTAMLDKLTDTLSSRRIPHRPKAFHTS